MARAVAIAAVPRRADFKRSRRNMDGFLISDLKSSDGARGGLGHARSIEMQTGVEKRQGDDAPDVLRRNRQKLVDGFAGRLRLATASMPSQEGDQEQTHVGADGD